MIIIFLMSTLPLLAKQSINAPLIGPTSFVTKKGDLWEKIKETPANTDHAVFISGFVGTSIIAEYLNQVVKGNFSVTIIRSYMSSGKNQNESSLIDEYNKKYQNQRATVITVNYKTHMKSYFWFNKQKNLFEL